GAGGEGNPAARRDRLCAAATGKRDGEAANFEKGMAPAHSTTLRGSNASRTASPTKISRLSIEASTKNAVRPSQGACRLALPWASSSPSEGEPGGSPKPGKASEVSVVIEPLRMNGRNVIVATVAFGSTWRRIMTRSATPRARAART